jgi:hypothetical protein
MLEVIILICSLNVTPNLRDCTSANAVDVIDTTVEVRSPSACLQQGQQRVAQMSFYDDLVAKISCPRVRQELSR